MLHSQILSDMTELRSQLRSCGSPHHELLRLSLVRPIGDIAFDWLVIFASVGTVAWFNIWLAPLAVCIIANRQRALGNILHDAGHRNLCRNRKVNDAVARVLVAALLFTSMSRYRVVHFQHHLALGDAVKDPDFLKIPAAVPERWIKSFIHNVRSRRAWLSSFAGDLAAEDVQASSKLFILGWWGVALALSVATLGAEFSATFVLLWLASRATVFHLITTFREMCDHFGLRPGGVFTFTRDMACTGFWRRVIHPRNNGYHLTHHLLPAVPYYRLPAAHELFSRMPAYAEKGQVCAGYFCGGSAVTRAWQAGEPA